MKKFYSTIVMLILSQYGFAQWPANYGGVMLQAFYWNSFEDTQWQKLAEDADTVSNYFDALWVPNSAWCTDGQSMGYDPVYWFRHKSTFGQARALKQMIQAYKAKNVSIIEDVVLNHKKPLGNKVTKDGQQVASWIDFANETPTIGGEKYNITWSGADICRNDDGGYTADQGWEVTGADDTGDDFSGYRDLDHTSAHVQENVKLYLRYLMEELGYDGFRLDMVKGYGGQFTKIYNEAVKPKFCVGEYWDGNVNTLVNWINSTGKTSAAFDFSLKYVIRDAFGGGNWSALSNKGLAGWSDYSRYAVTFIDNHDTYENQDRLTNNVLAANGLILAMPGTPCIFLKHWQRYPIAIGNMILARKACGVTNQSPITEQQSVEGGYVIKTQGSKGIVLYTCGTPSYDTTGFTLIVAGVNFAYYVSDNVKVEGLREGTDDAEDAQKTVTIYVEAADAPYLYSWNSAGVNPTGTWPGKQLTESGEVTSLDGTVTKTFWRYRLPISPVNIIFNNGSGVQTADITGVTHNSYYTFDATNSNKQTNWTEITSQFYEAPVVELPDCVKPIDGHVYCYFRGNKDFDTPYAWAWNASGDLCKNAWPGDAMTRVGLDGKYTVWLWDLGAATGSNMPTGVLFSNKGSDSYKTADFTFKNGGYYDVYELLGVASTTTGIRAVNGGSGLKVQDAVVYDLQGRRVQNPTRGLYIVNGNKVVIK